MNGARIAFLFLFRHNKRQKQVGSKRLIRRLGRTHAEVEGEEEENQEDNLLIDNKDYACLMDTFTARLHL